MPANFSVEISFKGCDAKKAVMPVHKREIAVYIVEEHNLSMQQACKTTNHQPDLVLASR